MGDVETLAKARLELEELYLGVPDDSVNLTFQDLADVKQKPGMKKTTSTMTIMEAIEEVQTPKHVSSPIKKLPSLDFNRALQPSKPHNLHDGYEDGADHHRRHYDHHDHHHHHHRNHVVESSIGAIDDVSGVSMASNFPDRGGRRRPGIAHSNICTICTTYICIFRHRCLVCGRVYCRNCVALGMGDMTEGRKCLDCLGRRFSQRYINKAGKVGCWSRYPAMVKQAELKWAEKGPRRSGERGYGRSGVMMSRSRSPMTPMRPHRGTSNPPSFVSPSSPYSPYTTPPTPTHHHLPF
ncbi:Extra-large GTP-binding protein 3 [Tripterygium wilfordii]|uniref:Extra-large GTP-binding protein 3 n=1 Tax=Tripterygium wilfordii TaxID=458696 RepID=A0A7J7C041_TRIWF|nr:uncharacterized protein LOC119992199 [Tripterygium wilfordii]KAF5727295.1 Extra-large GTP-binding protein 3 [Tripterygium wilfordii]